MKEVLLFITDAFADWEAAHVCFELNRHDSDYSVKTIAIDKLPKRSMGGLTVLPDYDVATVLQRADSPAMLVIVGGTSWREERNQIAIELVNRYVKEGTPIAAICDGVTFIANYGYLDNVQHTGNTIEYLKKGAPNYKGEDYFIEVQSVSDGNFITANGTACLEFGRDILAKLNVLEYDKLEEWYSFWKEGFYKE